MNWAVVVAAAAVGLAGAACRAPAELKLSDAGPDDSAVPGMTYVWNFDSDAAGGSPAGFAAVLGDWTVAADATAPSLPNVLRQTGAFGSGDFPRIFVTDVSFADLSVSVRCRPESGSTDEACGLMFRLVDEDNYFITRANALEGNVRLYKVVGGARLQIGSAAAPVTAGEWHTLAATACGSALTVSWDGAALISLDDATFAGGKIGLWTKADSVTAFDDLTATAQ
jgi:hypothetical protein